MGHLEQRHTLLCTGLRGGLNRGLEKDARRTGLEIASRFHTFPTLRRRSVPLKFARQIDV
jgi:hypothetical protein